jgi:hypothetical protein
MSTENSARAGTVIPSHGAGRLTPFRPGASGNPGGRPTSYTAARRALQDWASETGVKRLIELAGSPDDRVASVVVLGIFDRAYGKPKEFDPSEERKPVTINTSVLTKEERSVLLSALRKGLLREVDPGAPGEIEGKAER